MVVEFLAICHKAFIHSFLEGIQCLYFFPPMGVQSVHRLIQIIIPLFVSHRYDQPKPT
jgi:hypothetical protein